MDLPAFFETNFTRLIRHKAAKGLIQNKPLFSFDDRLDCSITKRIQIPTTCFDFKSAELRHITHMAAYTFANRITNYRK